jgi:hypothetical protein
VATAAPATGRPVEPPTVLRSADDLRAFGRRPGWRGEVALELPGIGPARRRALEKRINFWRGVCGCMPGALALLGTLVWRAPALLGARSAGDTAFELGLALLIAVLAKFVALAAARAALLIEVAALSRRLARGGQP